MFIRNHVNIWYFTRIVFYMYQIFKYFDFIYCISIKYCVIYCEKIGDKINHDINQNRKELDFLYGCYEVH